jgi:dTDP-4-dehydrorhamnose 3,5-epimerase
MSTELTITPTEIPEVLEVDSPRFGDQRGYFMEVYNESAAQGLGFHETFMQDNLSKSAKGIMRGLHYQIEPHAQGKLVHVLAGRAWDVAVDIRRGSPTYAKWVARELSGDNGLALWVPPGFAHGFLALEDDTLLMYKCTTPYAPTAERSIHFACPKIGIDWPVDPETISDKDREAPTLQEADHNFEFNAA